MEHITFTVCTPYNPVPYKRTTQRQKYVDINYQRYLDYKALIIAEFARVTKSVPWQILYRNKKYHVETMAFFKDKKHADMSNIHKGVEDAIFASPLNDKYCSGSFDYCYDKANPRLHVTISEA